MSKQKTVTKTFQVQFQGSAGTRWLYDPTFIAETLGILARTIASSATQGEVPAVVVRQVKPKEAQ